MGSVTFYLFFQYVAVEFPGVPIRACGAGSRDRFPKDIVQKNPVLGTIPGNRVREELFEA
jgi:hypothetical protein